MSATASATFDVILVALALVGIVAFIVFDRPQVQIALMAFIALVWSVDLTFIASGARADALRTFWHPIFGGATALAALGILLLRRAPRRR